MTAVWGDDVVPVIINISVKMKADILAKAPRLLVEFDLTCGDFWLKVAPYIRYHVLTYPDLIHPRELAVVADAVGQPPHDPT